jgi:hypothetical protein
MKWKDADQSMFNETHADLEYRRITAILAVDQVSPPSMKGKGMCGNQPEIQQDHCQSQARQPLPVVQHGTYQIKVMSFHVAKHLIDPHSTNICLKRQPAIKQISEQAPRFSFPLLPILQQVGRIDFAFRQPNTTQPATLSRLLHPTAKGLPLGFLCKKDQHGIFLTQSVIPLIQFSKHLHRYKSAITDQQHRTPMRQQAAHTVHSFPGDRNSTSPVGRTNDQQLVQKADFTAIYDQPGLPPCLDLTGQPLLSNRFIPFLYRNRRVRQQAAQVTCHADQFHRSWDFSGYLAQAHRMALVYPDNQQYEKTNLRDPLVRAQYLYSLNPGMIECVDWNGQSEAYSFCCKN